MEFAGFQVWTISEKCVSFISKTLGTLSFLKCFLPEFHDLGLELHPEVEESRLGETRRAEERRTYGFSLDFECQMAAPGLNE